MIHWKRNHPAGSFDHFMLELFPENARTDGRGRITLDTRVEGRAWREVFERLTAADEVHDIGELAAAAVGGAAAESAGPKCEGPKCEATERHAVDREADEDEADVDSMELTDGPVEQIVLELFESERKYNEFLQVVAIGHSFYRP